MITDMETTHRQSTRATSIGCEVGHLLVGPKSAIPPPCSPVATPSQPFKRKEEREERKEREGREGKRRRGRGGRERGREGL